MSEITKKINDKYTRVTVKTALAAVTAICMLTSCGEKNNVPENIVDGTEMSASDISESAETAASQTTTASESVETTASQTTTASESTETTVTQTEETATAPEYMDTIKEIFANRDDTPLYYKVGAADVTGDGFPELFVYCTSIGQTGYMDIYDVADGGAKLGTVNCRDAKGNICTDENGELHLIVVDDYFFSTNTQHTAYFDLCFSDGKSEMTVPLLRIVYAWFEDTGEHCFVDRYYKDCVYTGIDNTEYFDLEKNEHNLGGFKFYEDNFIMQAEIEEREDEEIAKMIDEKVFDGLTKLYEIEEITTSKEWITPNDFYKFAEEYLKEIYAD